MSWKSKRLGFFAMNGSALAVARPDMHFPAVSSSIYLSSPFLLFFLPHR